jgi:hypothetical protein
MLHTARNKETDLRGIASKKTMQFGAALPLICA